MKNSYFSLPRSTIMDVSALLETHRNSLKVILAVKDHPVLYINNVQGASLTKLQDFRNKVWVYLAKKLGVDCKYILRKILIVHLEPMH